MSQHERFRARPREVFGPSQQDGGPELIQLLTPEGERVDHPDFSFDAAPTRMLRRGSTATWC